MQRRHPDIRRDLIVLQISGHLFFLGLALISVVFWKERQAFDAAHYLFELIDRKFFFIAHQRPIGVVSQVLPLIGIWLKLPLSFVAVLYSLGDILWYYLVFLLLAYGFESRKGIVSLLLILSLTVQYSFFCPVTELLQAGALIPVWLCLLDRSFRFRYVALMLLAALIIFSHPLLFYPLFFSLFWWAFQQSRPGLYIGNGRKYFIAMLMTVLATLTVLKLLLLDKYDYDKTFYPVVYEDYGYLHTFQAGVFFQHVKVVALGYPIVSILFITAIGVMLWFRRWWQALYLLSAVAGFILIMSLTHRFDHLSNYFERMLLPIPMMLALVSASIITITRTFLSRLVAYVGLVLILLMHFDVLRIISQPYTARVGLLQDLCSAAQSLQIRKGIVSEELLEQNSYAMTGWCYPIETLLFSSCEGPDHSVTIALEKEHIGKNRQKETIAKPDEWIKWAELNLPVQSLNPVYFRLPAGNYASLTSGDTSYTGTVSIELKDARPMKPGSIHLEIEFLLPGKNILPNVGQTYLTVRNAQQQDLFRSVLPYSFRTSGRWSFNLNEHDWPDGPISLILFAGTRKTGELSLMKTGSSITWADQR